MARRRWKWKHGKPYRWNRSKRPSWSGAGSIGDRIYGYERDRNRDRAHMQRQEYDAMPRHRRCVIWNWW